jgi:hypothetical protein
MSLWDEYDDQLKAATGVKHGRARGLTEQAIVSSTRGWLLQDYARAFCRALAATRLYHRCYWIDGWGPDRPAHTPSLSAAIADLSHELARGDKPLALHGLLLDASAGKRGKPPAPYGASAWEALTLPAESAALRASWPEIAPALLKEIELAPAIFLLRPFGQALFTYADLSLLYQRSSAPTELCLLIGHRHIELHVASASRSAEHAASLTALLRTDRWKALRSDATASAFDVSGIVALLQSVMQQHFRWVIPVTLSLQVRPALVESAPYSLLFASRHRESLLSMNDALCLFHHRLSAQSRQGILAEGWFARQEEERSNAQIQQLRGRVLHLGRARRARRWPDLRQQLLLEHFGLFTLGAYDTVMRDLLLSGALRCEWRRPAPAENDQQRVPGNDDTLLWN